jgi:hypothetical protein
MFWQMGMATTRTARNIFAGLRCMAKNAAEFCLLEKPVFMGISAPHPDIVGKRRLHSSHSRTG